MLCSDVELQPNSISVEVSSSDTNINKRLLVGQPWPQASRRFSSCTCHTLKFLTLGSSATSGTKPLLYFPSTDNCSHQSYYGDAQPSGVAHLAGPPPSHLPASYVHIPNRPHGDPLHPRLQHHADAAKTWRRRR